MTTKRWLMPLCALGAALAAACGGSEENPAAGSGGSSGASNSGGGAERVLRVSQGSDVLSMDPYFRFESPTICVLMNIFDTITDISPEMKIVPGLAESWRNIDPTHWEFKLRQGVKFHEGQDFAADDARYSLLRARDWQLSKVSPEIPTIKDIAAPDPHTILIETTVPDAILPTRLTSIMILDKESAEAGVAKEGDQWLATRPNGTGPYRLEEWRKDDATTLSAFEGYWRGAPAIKKVKFLAVSNDASRVNGFLAGQFDLVAAVPVQDIDRVGKTPGFKLISNPSLRLIYLGLDCGRENAPGVPGSPPNPLMDARVRRAMYLAINEELIVEKIMNGQAKPAAQLWPEGITGYAPEITRPAYDPEAAKKLLAEAGYPNGFKVRLDSPNDRYVNDAKIAAAVAGQLAKVGIEVEVNALPKARFFTDEAAGLYSFFLLGWTNGNGDGVGTFDHLLHTFDAKKNLGGANRSSNYSNAELDRISEASYGEFDPAKREEMLRECVRIAMKDLPHIPLHFQMDLYAVSDKLAWTPRRDTLLRAFEMKWK